MADVEDTTIECGFCWRQNEDMKKPKTLPCSHVHCFGCLTAFFEINHMARCPVPGCREVVDVSLDNLPSYDLYKWCDVCIDKRLGNQPALTYCTNCEKKYCSKHEKSHDDFTQGHKKFPISEYKAQSSNLRERKCTKHKNQMYSLGCRNCLKLICTECVPGLTTCADGKQHKVILLSDLVTALVEENMKSKMLAKEQEYEKLFKLTSQVSSEYHLKTTEMIQLLRDTRDEQQRVIREKYEKMEEELIEKRQKKRLELAGYLEDQVLTQWTQLRNQIHKLESKLKHGYQVDIVRAFSELKDQLHKLVDEELPKLEMIDVVQLSQKEECRYSEIEIVSSDDMIIDGENGFQPSAPLLKSLQHLRTIQLSTCVPSICQYNGYMYISQQNKGIARLDSNNQLDESFISSFGRVDCITVHGDRLYALVPGTTEVRVFDMAGKQVTQWNVTCGRELCNAMTVVSDQLVIADQPNQRINVYSLSGQLVQSTPCTLLGDRDHRFMCAVDDDSVVISVYVSLKVFRVNVGTGEVIWSCNLPTNPGSVTCYSRRYTLVANYSGTKIWCIDNQTGKIVSEITTNSLGSCVFGLQTIDQTVVTANYSPPKLMWFKMHF